MRVVMVADDWVEAHIARGLLEGAGIECRLLGESLSGAVGELPATGLFRLAVAERDEARALALLAQWRGGGDEATLEA
ncbi:MAG: DUF2007 domain-containing protein [Xanthomonadales bacterium]|nr:DUF2007 domain-containing protein [Xanthomonadales bacterium]